MHDHEGSIRAKVLGELMGHMISLHGKPSGSPSIPHVDGTAKHAHDPLGAHSMGSTPMADAMAEKPEPEVGEHEPETTPDDLFGRKTGKKMAF